MIFYRERSVHPPVSRVTRARELDQVFFVARAEADVSHVTHDDHVSNDDLCSVHLHVRSLRVDDAIDDGDDIHTVDDRWQRSCEVE